MPIRVISWTEDEAKQNLAERLQMAKEFRSQFEPQWRENENLLYNAVGYREEPVSVSYSSEAELLNPNSDDTDIDVGINHIFRHWRFTHSQMSSNPPSVIARPASSDPRDRQAAVGADRVVRWMRKQMSINEFVDQATAKTLSKGTGWLKTIWDANAGKIKRFDQATGMVIMTGDHKISSPSTWNIWADPDACTWDSCQYVFEKITMPLEEAKATFIGMDDALAQVARSVSDSKDQESWFFKRRRSNKSGRQLVDVYEYYEKASPFNGMAGRFARCLEDGTLLQPMSKNPHWEAQLPYHPLTEIDIEDQIYGKSTIEYQALIQDVMNRLDGQTLDNIKTHNVVRMYKPQGCEIADDSIKNISTEIIEGSGPVGPTFLQPPGSMQDAVRFREQLQTGSEMTAGVNESMFGQVNREMSALSLQTAINAGNTIRKRLFNKYTMFVESVYRHMLGLAIEHWDVKRTIRVLGEENAFEVVDIKGSDLQSGWDLDVEYGASLSLDPATRREEIIQLIPFLKEAGFSMASILDMLRLNEVGEVYDRATLGRRRQREIFDKMIASFLSGEPKYIAPEELQDHKNYLDYAYTYLQTAQFSKFDPDLKALLRQHVRDREALLTQEAQSGQVPAPAVPGPGVPIPGGGAAPQSMTVPQG